MLARGGPAPTPPDARATQAGQPPPPPAELPRGGRSILPEHRVVAHYGAPQAEALGILGIGTPAAAAARLQRAARAYAGPGRRPVLPAMELIAVIVTAAPGADGRHRFRQDPAVIRRYLAAARRARALLILDIQPGRSDFVTEARALAPFLVQPDVGLALDPEWRMSPGRDPRAGDRPGGRRRGRPRLGVGVAARGGADDLPDKLVLVHQFQDGIIERRGRLRAHRGVTSS